MAGEIITQQAVPMPPAARLRRGLLAKLPTRAFARMGWGLADQAVSSLTNVAVSFYLVHTLAPQQFGAFSLAYTSYGFALNASRGLSTDPLMVRYSGVEVKRWRRAVAGATGTALTVGVTSGIVAVAAAIALGGVAGAAFLALGLTLPGLMLQDSWRFSFFASGRGGHAFLNDMIWAALLVPAIVVLRLTGHATVFWVLFAWGAAAGCAALVGPFQARVIPRMTHTWLWCHLHRDLGPRYLAEGLASNSGVQARSYGMGFMLGLTSLGYFQATSTIYGPVSILFMALGLVAIPEGARVLRRSPSKFGLFCVVLAVGMSAIAMAWVAVLLVGMPLGLGRLMLGSHWRPTYPLVLPIGISIVGVAVSSGTGAGLHALGASRKSLAVMISASAMLVAFSLIGAELDGVQGACWGTALSQWVASGVWWWQLRVAMREAKLTTPAGSGLFARFRRDKPAQPPQPRPGAHRAEG
ncbi:MAG TPA: hypothetical protein VHZ03_22155 [Trebonia sp.]|jgi:O-antigen/teichoic acid export membrane protein|nr:hypothetical protein [Trebonia sp.]